MKFYFIYKRNYIQNIIQTNYKLPYPADTPTINNKKAIKHHENKIPTK